MPRKKSSDIETDAIARKAYELWEGRGYPHGDPEHDWYEAERHLKAEADGKKAGKPKRKSAAKKGKAGKSSRTSA
jgi:hypothetical protein